MAPLLLAKSLDATFSRASLDLCAPLTISSYFLSMMNALLPVSILLFRLIHVYLSHRIMTADERRALNNFILAFTFGVPVLLATGIFYYKEHYKPYQQCIGDGVVGPNFLNLPTLHPLPLATIIVFLIRSSFIPIGYTLIFFFTERTARKAPGLSESARAKRRARNAVNAKFNCYIWMFEMSGSVVLLFKGTFINRTYILLSFGISPLLYLIGMEESRSELQNLLTKLMRA